MKTATTPEAPRQGAEAMHGALQTMLETAEYVSDRTTRLATNVNEGVKAGETLGAVVRQIRTLSSNTSLEASRLGGSPTVAEIARQMRLLSQQVSVLTEHLMSCLRSQNVAVHELSGAIDTLLADTASTQALTLYIGAASGPAREAPSSVAPRETSETITYPEADADG